MAKKVLGTRPRGPGDPTLREEVDEFLRASNAAQQAAAEEQAALAAEIGDAELASRERFRFSSRQEIEQAAFSLARRLRRESDPSDAEVRAAAVMIMDAEDQRRILFEQRTGVRTPSPLTGLSSLDDPRAMEDLARRTGVGARVPGRFAATFGPRGPVSGATAGTEEFHRRALELRRQQELDAAVAAEQDRARAELAASGREQAERTAREDQERFARMAREGRE